MKTGFSHIIHSCEPESIVVTLDTDGQHSVRDALRVAEQTAGQPDTLILGVRTFGTDTPLRSRFGNTVTRGVYRISTGNRIRDTQTGLRGCDEGLLSTLLEVPGERFEYEMNMLMACPKLGIPIREIPIETIYQNGNKSAHFRMLEDSVRIYANILEFAASSLIGFLVDCGLYSLLVVMLSGLGTTVSIPLANVEARVVSAATNFTINKRVVFRHQGSAWKVGVQYFGLAACILCGNAVLLSVMITGLGMNKFAAKLVTELTFALLRLCLNLGYPTLLSRNAWHCGIMTLTIGSCLHGIFDIYGTFAPLICVYWVAEAGLMALRLSGYLMERIGTSCAPPCVKKTHHNR